MGNENLLPKNIRQIGEIQGRQRICLEDYVMTYIRKMESRKEENNENYLGVFLGERKSAKDMEYVFARGILEIRDLGRESRKVQGNAPEQSGENLSECKEPDRESEDNGMTGETDNRKKPEKNDENEQEEKTGSGKKTEKSGETSQRISVDPWERLKREQEMHFPGCEILGCCVIGRYPAGRLEELFAHFPQARSFLYHLQDQEERLYWLDGEKYEGLQGYFVFYEQNRRMQEYLEDVFGETTVENEGMEDKAIVRFREKVKSKAEEKSKSFLKLASSFFVVGVLLAGVVAVNRVEDIRESRETLNDAVTVSNVTESMDPETENTAITVNSENTLAGADEFWADDTEEGELADIGDAETEEDARAESGSDVSTADAETAKESTSYTAASGTEEAETASARQVQASYVIREGDTLAEICTKYYGSLDFLEELCEANGIEDANLIRSGQKIILP